LVRCSVSLLVSVACTRSSACFYPTSYVHILYAYLPRSTTSLLFVFYMHLYRFLPPQTVTRRTESVGPPGSRPCLILA
jgi:hypothetical protein